MEFTYSDIRMAMAGNNENVAKLIKQKIAESENAAVALVFDDKLIVLDEENDKFYSVITQSKASTSTRKLYS